MQLAKKNILLIGDKTDVQLKSLQEALLSEEATVHIHTCDLITPQVVNDLHVDLVFLYHLHGVKPCKGILKELTKSSLTDNIPVFTLVQDVDSEIQEVLTSGAADYITTSEQTFSMVEKIKLLLSQNQALSDNAVIDISPIEPSVSTKGIKVYVVEDDPLLRNLLSIKLSKSKFPFEFSTDGRGVVNAMLQFGPNVIILDLMLPGISGLDVLKTIKENDALKDIPVIVFSNRDNSEDKATALNLGAAKYYIKAMTDLSELVEIIDELSKK